MFHPKPIQFKLPSKFHPNFLKFQPTQQPRVQWRLQLLTADIARLVHFCCFPISIMNGQSSTGVLSSWQCHVPKSWQNIFLNQRFVFILFRIQDVSTRVLGFMQVASGWRHSSIIIPSCVRPFPCSTPDWSCISESVGTCLASSGSVATVNTYFIVFFQIVLNAW